jgi:periplasmic divalent cation tolerance protein
MMTLLYTTFPNIDVAKKICQELIATKKIKCANLFPQGVSIYEWQGQFKTENEIYAYLKTNSDKVFEVEDYLRVNHPYETFCLLQMDPQYVVEEFKNWVEINS